MLDLSVAPIAPVLSAAAGGALVVALRGRNQTITDALWLLWAGVAGGQVANAALSAEFLGMGTGGAAAGALGGVAAAAVLSALMRVGSRPERTTDDPVPPPDRGRPTYRRDLLLAGAAIAVALLAAWAGLGLAAALLLVVLAGVGSAAYGMSFAAGVFVATSLASAGIVVLGRVLLSPVQMVGDPVPAVAVAAAVLVPLLLPATRPETWALAWRRAGALDAVAFLVAGIAASAWWRLLRGLDQDQTVSQLVRLGEDHLSHLLMFEATTVSGTALGGSERSLDVTSLFAGYFPGSSIWQTSVGGLLSTGSVIDQYVFSSVALIGMLAFGATAAAAGTASRSSAMAVVGVLAIGAIGTRASLAMYELGFPGQLLVASWLVAALILITTREVPRWLTAGVLALLAIGSWWTWSLAAPVLVLTLAVFVTQWLLGWRRPSARVLAGVSALALMLLSVGALAARHKIRADLDTLSLEGGVFRGIPLWLSFVLILAFPLACLARGHRAPPAATALVLGLGAATVGLMSWQLLRVGSPTYYTYKLEYLLLGLGWAVGTMWFASVVGRWESGFSTRQRLAAGTVAVVLAIPLTLWPSENYQGWLGARGVLGPDEAMSCAVESARDLPAGSVALATGFGEPISNYLVTKAMDVSLRNNYSASFWSAVLNQPDPTTWPWLSTPRPLYLVEGPVTTSRETADIVRAAHAAGTKLTLAGSCS